MINGPDQIYVERSGQLQLTGARFRDARGAHGGAPQRCAIRRQARRRRATRSSKGASPTARASRRSCRRPRRTGRTSSIRRFFKETLTVERLVELRRAARRSPRQRSRRSSASKLNILIAGGTGSGKTSMLNALSSFIPDGRARRRHRGLARAPAPEPHVVQLEARPADPRGTRRSHAFAICSAPRFACGPTASSSAKSAAARRSTSCRP